jgi:2'-5' RNA ligase
MARRGRRPAAGATREPSETARQGRLTPTGRLFLAVDPPASVRAVLGRWARSALEPGHGPVDRRTRPARAPSDGIRRVPSDGVRRIGPDALHITVCFLGDQPLDVVDEVGEIVHDAVIDLATAGLSVGPLGVGAPVWLPPRRPRALALEIHDEAGGLTALHDDLRVRLGSAIGWEPDRRRFRPHITLARLRTGVPPPACVEPTPPVVFEPGSITLYRSRLEPAGAIYETLVRVELDVDGGGSLPW